MMFQHFSLAHVVYLLRATEWTLLLSAVFALLYLGWFSLYVAAVDGLGRLLRRPRVKAAIERVTGVLRVYGTPLEELVGKWATAFRKHHGQVRLNAYLINTSQAFAGLVTGSADIGLMGHRQWRNGFQAFEAQYGYAPLEIRFASGSYDDPQGTTPGLMFIVNKNNPLAGLTLSQIDGLYGAQRTGGWVNGKWTTASARGEDQNIRTWGQLGLTGEWTDKPIHLYGSDVTLSNWADLIERECFQGGTKWNPTLNEAPRADIGTKAQGKTRDQLILEVELDRSRGGIYKFNAKALVGEELAAEAVLMCTMRTIT